MTSLLIEFSKSLLELTLEAAPWLVLGLVVAGLAKAWIPTDRMARWLGKPGSASIFRAAVVGTPLPLCSCGVLPAAIGLKRQGASNGATISFLVATPANGADSIAVSYALLGPVLTVARLLAALVSAMAAGLLAELITWGRSTPSMESSAKSSCCSEPAPETKSCCAEPGQPKSTCCDAEASPIQKHWVARMREGIGYAFTDILMDILMWLTIGLIAAAAIDVFIPETILAQWGRGPVGLLVMLVIGLPMYICATASVPVAASLLAAGVGPGAVVVFLLAGPATNIGTVMAIYREMGRGPLAGYLLGVCGGALAFGLGTDAMIAAMQWDIQAQVTHAHEMMPAWVAWSALLMLVSAVLYAGVQRMRRAIANRSSAKSASCCSH